VPAPIQIDFFTVAPCDDALAGSPGGCRGGRASGGWHRGLEAAFAARLPLGRAAGGGRPRAAFEQLPSAGGERTGELRHIPGRVLVHHPPEEGRICRAMGA
jgi:hypothetical protein